MKKKIFFSIIIIAILIVLIAIVLVIKRTNSSSIQTEVDYFIMQSYKYDEDVKNKIISNYKDFKKFVEKYDLEENEDLAKYNEQYFKNKSLAVAFITETNSADSKEINEVIADGNSLVIRYSENKDDGRDIGMDVMSSTMVFAEIDKNVKSIKLIKE